MRLIFAIPRPTHSSCLAFVPAYPPLCLGCDHKTWMAGSTGHGGGYTSTFPRRKCSRVMHRRAPEEGVGNAGRSAHPQPRAQKGRTHELVTAGRRCSPAFPHANGFNAYSTLSPAIGLFVTVPGRDAEHSCRVDVSVETSGPRGFASAGICRSSFDHVASTASPPNVRDDRETPLEWAGTAGLMPMILARREGIYFLSEDWTSDGIALAAWVRLAKGAKELEPA